jgi:hypothetical protein
MKKAVLLLLISGSVWADTAALQNCRAITDARARLACYDAITLPAANAAVPIRAATATSPAVPATPAQPTAAPIARAATAAPPAPPAAASFGLTAPAPDAAINKIESSINGLFEGWRPNSRIRLANGQVWQVTDDSARSLDLNNPKVAVRRGALGAFYLEIDGTNFSPRVRRVQ